MSHLERALTDFYANMLCWQKQREGVLTASEAVSVWAAAKTGWICFWKAFCWAEACNWLSNPFLSLSFKHTYAHCNPTSNFLAFCPSEWAATYPITLSCWKTPSPPCLGIYQDIARVCFPLCYPQGELAHSGRAPPPSVMSYSWRDVGYSCRTL